MRDGSGMEKGWMRMLVCGKDKGRMKEWGTDGMESEGGEGGYGMELWDG